MKLQPIKYPYIDSVVISNDGLYLLYSSSLWKYDFSGNLLWDVKFNSSSVSGHGISLANNGIYVLGCKNSVIINGTNAGIQKYSKDGKPLWEAFWDDGVNESFFQMKTIGTRAYLIGSLDRELPGLYTHSSFLMQVNMTPPSQPINLRHEISNDKIKLTWSPSNDSGGIGPARYEVLKGYSESTLQPYATTGNANSFIDNQTLGKGEEYVYAVRAYTPFGNSTLSNPISVHYVDNMTWLFWVVPVAVIAILISALIIAFIRRRKRR
jgi:hypothetical protein